MNSCSPELVTLIFELACANDLGETARRLGLVSKYFRAIAEPIELRSIAIPGIKQLRGAVARLDDARTLTSKDGRLDVTVRDLFISELTEEHAILADKNFENSYRGQRSSFWITKEGREAEQFYFENSDEFWNLATKLVKKTSSTLKTLVLLSSSRWFSWRGSYDLDRVDPRLLDLLTYDGRMWRREYSCTLKRRKVLGVLSGVELPNLECLTINHNATSEMNCFRDDSLSFQSPIFPVLRRLHLASSLYVDTDTRIDQQEHVHPLLARVVPESMALEELILCDDNMKSVEVAMKAIFGPDWRALLSRGLLPGKLRSVVLQQGMEDAFWCGTGYMAYKREVGNFVCDVEHLNVAGLVAQYPTKMFPEAGEREYEILFSAWKERCLAARSWNVSFTF